MFPINLYLSYLDEKRHAVEIISLDSDIIGLNKISCIDSRYLRLKFLFQINALA